MCPLYEADVSCCARAGCARGDAACANMIICFFDPVTRHTTMDKDNCVLLGKGFFSYFVQILLVHYSSATHENALGA